MANTSTIVAGVAFVTLAAVNVLVMLEASQPSRNGTTRTRLIALHKAGGYLFVTLLSIMAYSNAEPFFTPCFHYAAACAAASKNAKRSLLIVSASVVGMP
jgi:hypothetical protein